MKKIIKKIIINLYTLSYLIIKKKAKSKINLASGDQRIPGYINLDYSLSADIPINLNWGCLPFKDDTVEVVVCTSAINYFTKERARIIISETYRVLKIGGVVRFSTQDLRVISRAYVDHNIDLFKKQRKLTMDCKNNETDCDIFNEWISGYPTLGGRCKYIWDYETLEIIFHEVGFKEIKKMNYMESKIIEINQIDNRQDQMFYLEAVK